MNEDFKQLRKKLDSNDPFMAGGHQIKKIRTRKKIVPTWAITNEKTQEVLLKAFPKWKTSASQRKSAARWARAIHLYYRLGMPHNQVAAEMGLGYNTLRMLLRNIRNSAKGTRSRGRPAK